MEQPTEWIKAFLELTFPVAVAVYLLINQSRQIEEFGKRVDRFRHKLTEVKIGLYLILEHLDAREEYEQALKSYRDQIKGDQEDREDI